MFLLYYLYEKLHRYVFDYCLQSTNTDWGNHTPYKEANKRNKFRKHNDKALKLYNFLYPFFYKFRYKLCIYFPKKYQRYSPSKFLGITKYETYKYYNFYERWILKLRIYFIKRERKLKLKPIIK